MSKDDFEEFCKETLRARTAKSTSTNKTDDAIAVIMTLGLVTTNVAKAIVSMNSNPLQQA